MEALFVVLMVWSAQGQLFPEPTRPVNLWDPFGASTTPRPKDQRNDDEVVVRLRIGDVLGQSIVIPNLPWTPDQDPLEQIPPNREQFDPNPLPINNSVKVFAFLGVPYAEPPVGERRFKPPQQLIHFPGQSPYLALKFGAACAQDVELRPSWTINDLYPFDVNEDCLYLNVFTPDVSKTSGRSYPVMIFFHGGNFQTGAANDWPAHGLASRGIVVVTVNYRLGPFGYMSLGDSTTGNYGFLDQRASMEWVQEHISSFGGDPQAVTIVGHDAGGASVGLHMLSPFSKNLFRAASSMSGAEVSYHSTIGKPALAFNNTIKLGRYLGCTQALPTNVWECILTRSTDDITRATTNVPIEYNRYLFMPVVDGLNIPANPLWTLNNVPTGGANYPSPVPYLVGMNAQDGSEVVLENRYLGEFNQFNNVDQKLMESFALEYSFRHNYTMNKEAIAQALIDRYTYWPDAANTWMIRDLFVQLATDAYYTAPIALSAHLHSAAGSRTFMYVNNYNISRGNDDFRWIPSWMSVCRDCDLYLLFGYPHMPPELRPFHLKDVSFTQNDRNASQLFSSIYRRFVYHQNPNFYFDGSWSAYEPRGHWYMNFNYTNATEMRVPGTLEKDYRYQDIAFWNEYIPSLVNYMTTTFPPEEVVVRRQLTAMVWVVVVLVIIIMLLVVIAGSFGYKIFEGEHYEARKEQRLLEVVSTNLPSNSSLDRGFRRGYPSEIVSVI